MPKKTKLNQDHLHSILTSIFPHNDIHTNARKVANILSPITRQYLELDFWLPEWNLAFEYQDPYHYYSYYLSYFPLDKISNNDNLKKDIAAQLGVSLIEIPFWWNGKLDSLVATIHKQRPDVLPSLFPHSRSLADILASPEACPIPMVPPSYFKLDLIPDVGQLMVAIPTISSVFDPMDWWMSEKYDGSRVCWNPNKRILYTRSTRALPIPSKFLAHFPNSFLDGEIWFGRATFDKSQRFVIMTKPALYPDLVNEVPIENLRLLAFDDPDPLLPKKEHFEDRVRSLLDNLPSDSPFFIPVSCVISKGKRHAKEYTQALLQNSGEGSILRRPLSAYSGGCSADLCKFKAHRDREGLVVSCEPDGTYTLQLPDGVTFKSTANAENLPKLPIMGDIVSFSFQRFGHNKQPQSAHIDKIRKDVSWVDVLSNFREQILWKERTANAKGLQVVDTQFPRGHWTTEEGKNTKLFFDEFATKKGLDPRDPNTWYQVKGIDISAAKGNGVFRHYGNSLVKAIMDVYPDIGLEQGKFVALSKNYWSDKANKVKFFNSLAHKRGFDPLVPNNWYQIPRFHFKTSEKVTYLTEPYGGSLIRTLMDVYPNIGLEESKFSRKSNFYWHNEKHRRAPLLDYAKQNGFDPLIPDNWYSLTKDQLMGIKGGSQLLRYHGSSVIKVLTDLFPNIGLERQKFSAFTKNYWHMEKRRSCFNTFAKIMDFDPHVRDNWYQVGNRAIRRDKAIRDILSFCYSGSLSKALEDIYSLPSPISHKRRAKLKTNLVIVEKGKN